MSSYWLAVTINYYYTCSKIGRPFCKTTLEHSRTSLHLSHFLLHLAFVEVLTVKMCV